MAASRSTHSSARTSTIRSSPTSTRPRRRSSPGDRVILCSPTPSWVEAVDDPGSYDTIDYFVRTVLQPDRRRGQADALRRPAPLRALRDRNGRPAADPLWRRRRLPLPDAPHAEADPGAAAGCPHAQAVRADPRLRPEADVPDEVAIPRATRAGSSCESPPATSASSVCSVACRPRSCSPCSASSSRLSVTAHRWIDLPVALLGLLIFAGAVLFAKSPTGRHAHSASTHRCSASTHGLLQIGLGVLGTWAWFELPLVHTRWPWPIPATLVYLVVIGLAATLLFCAYLLIASAFGVNVNELFSGQSIIDSKSFLRLHIAADGTLTIYPIAVPKVSRKWRATPEAAPTAPWLEPAKPIAYALAEAPITDPLSLRTARNRPGESRRPKPGCRNSASRRRPSGRRRRRAARCARRRGRRPRAW